MGQFSVEKLALTGSVLSGNQHPGALDEVEEMETIYAAISDIHREMEAEGRPIRSKESSTNYGQWKGRRIRGLRDKLRSNENHGPTWVRRAIAEALVRALPPNGTSGEPAEPVEDTEESEEPAAE